MISWVLALQVLTNLPKVSPGAGLPQAWQFQRPRAATLAKVSVTGERALRIDATAAAAFVTYKLEEPIPATRGGVLVWRWTTATPQIFSDLRSKGGDDSPIRLMVVFADDRWLLYSWGNNEQVGDAFRSWNSSMHAVIILRRSDDALGLWRRERRDPFADYRLAFKQAPPNIVAVGVSANTDRLGGASRGEIAGIEWDGPPQPGNPPTAPGAPGAKPPGSTKPPTRSQAP